MTVTTAPNSSAPTKADHFLPIAVSTLTGDAGFPFDLYHRPGAAQFCLYRRRQVHVAAADLALLTDLGVKTLYIHFADQGRYSDYLQTSLLADCNLSPEARYEKLRAATRSIFETAFAAENMAELTVITGQLGKQLVEVLCSREVMLEDLFVLMVHDYYTFTHATNVCTYALAIADRLGGATREQLESIAAGALLHDVGKRRVPNEILDKQARLTVDERKIIERHPQWGFEMLCPQAEVDWGQLMMVFQHHERIDGSGYPTALCDGEIHDWAKLCAVADVFDALTSDRSHRPRWPVPTALEYLQQQAGVTLDKEIVGCLKAIMHGN